METERICPSCKKPLAADAPMGLCPQCLLKGGFATEAPTAAGGNFVPLPVEEITKLFPNLEILGFLGKGGMGAVYKARQPNLDRLVALKILPPALSNEPGFLERFNREARALARLNHANIVTVHDFGRVGEMPYLLMELVDGANLRQMEQAGRLTPEQALAIVPQICEALQYAHNEGIVHRDIKPENLLMDKRGRVKITDFGIAKMVAAPGGKVALTGAKDVVGTPHYMAPEQIEKPQEVDHRADIYSLGVVFYEMLTGELPIGKFQMPSEMAKVDARLDEIVSRTLEKEPGRRYQQASEIKTRVENIAATPPPAFSPIPAAVGPRGASSDKLILPAFLLALFFGIFGAHRFYVGKFRSAIAQAGMIFLWFVLIALMVQEGNAWEPMLGLLLAGAIAGSMIWEVVDCILLACKAFFDGEGKRMTNWWSPMNGGIPPQPATTASAGNAPPPLPGSPSRPRDVRGIIVAPAICMMVVGGLRVVTALTILLFSGPMQSFADSILSRSGIELPLNLGWIITSSTIIFALIPASLAIFGAVKMSQLRSYGWALAAAILSILSFKFLGLAVGIWALIILLRADVKAAFAANRLVTIPATDRLPWVMAGIVAAGLLFAVGGHAVTSALRDQIFQDSADSDTADDASGDTNSTTFSAGSATNFSKTIAVGPTGRLMLKIDRGDVEVTGEGRDTFEIRVDRSVTRADKSKAARILADERVTVRQNGDEISVTAREPKALGGHGLLSWFDRPELEAHYQIVVPKGFGAHVETMGGDVKTTHVKGDVFSKTMGGELKFADIGGKVDGRTMGGEIVAEDCQNEMTLNTMGGGIKVQKFSGPGIKATTTGGDVFVDFESSPKSDSELNTTGGNVTAKLPAGAALNVDAHTTGGSVETDLPVQTKGKIQDNSLKGALNGGGPEIKLSTLGGDVKLLKRD